MGLGHDDDEQGRCYSSWPKLAVVRHPSEMRNENGRPAQTVWRPPANSLWREMARHTLSTYCLLLTKEKEKMMRWRARDAKIKNHLHLHLYPAPSPWQPLPHHCYHPFIKGKVRYYNNHPIRLSTPMTTWHMWAIFICLLNGLSVVVFFLCC
jgi:hypothetical protein